MTKRLLVVFASGLMLAVVLLSLAWAVNGPRFVSELRARHGWTIITFDDDDDAGPRATRTLSYDGSRPLTLDAPASLKFVRGGDARMTVEGPRDMVNAVRWENGRLFLAGARVVERSLKVTVVAPQLAGVILRGAGDVKLDGLAQPTLAVELDGAGDIAGSGKVDRLTVTGRGAGNVDLARLDAGDATVRAQGIGNVAIAATGKVDVAITGVGDVSLHKKPRELTSSVTGVGAIEHDY